MAVNAFLTCSWGAHDVKPHPYGKGRWCARCGVVETTVSIEGQACYPLTPNAQPYGGPSQSPVTVDAEDRLDRYEDALHDIQRWSEAYPLSIFPEPDLKKARALLEAGGMTLDSLSAHCMRHVVEGVGKIARRALSGATLEASAPRPAGDLAGQGEPVAWAYEWFSAGQQSWRPALSFSNPSRDPVRNIRPLYAAPAPSRPADRAVLQTTLNLLLQTHLMPTLTKEERDDLASEILDLFVLRDASRDAGNGWFTDFTTTPDGNFLAGAHTFQGAWRQAVVGFGAGIFWDWPFGERPTHWRPLPAPPSPNPTGGTQDTDQGGGR